MLGEDYEADELLGTDLGEMLTATLLPQGDHEVQDRFTSQDFVADVGAHHDRRLVSQDGCSVTGPDGQPSGETNCWSKPPHPRSVFVH